MTSSALMVDDDGSAAEVLTQSLERRGFALTFKTSAAEALAALEERDYDVLISDLQMDGMDGLQLCERVVGNRPDLPVVIMTGFGNLDAAIAAMRAGAYDFITKPFDLELLALRLRRAVQHRSLVTEVRRLERVVSARQGLDQMIGSSPAIERVKALIERVADSNAAVLISGESGTGKELVARAVHQRSKNAGGPFVAINCAAVPEALLESELFGHVRGAFTDARTARQGLFLKAHGGTLFLDEITDLPLQTQPKLLRALQERTVRPVGGDKEEPYEARIIPASNRDLEGEVAAGRFREDLYYRINVVRVVLPPLHTRENDVLLLAQHFVGHFAQQMNKRVTGISVPVAERLTRYAWPGNVRELQNCIERAVAFARFAELIVDDLPEKVRDYRSRDLSIPGVDARALLTMDEVERRYVLRVLEQVDGSKAVAAEVLGIDRRTLYRKLAHWDHGPTSAE